MMKFYRTFAQVARMLLWSVGMIVLLTYLFCLLCGVLRDGDCHCILQFDYPQLWHIVLGSLIAMAFSWVVGLVGGLQLQVPSVTLISMVTLLSSLTNLSDMFRYDQLRSVEEGGSGYCNLYWICLGFVVVWLAIVFDGWLAYRKLKPEGRALQFFRQLLWVVLMIGMAIVMGMFEIGIMGDGLAKPAPDSLSTLMALFACLLAGWVGGRHLIIPSGLLAVEMYMLCFVF